MGVTRATLAAIKPVLIALAARTELFPPEHFPVTQGGHGKVYRLAEDSDRRFALYASAGVPGKAQPPHNHTTWAVIAGVFGDEHNVFYKRIDNRERPGFGRIRKTGDLTVRKGNACAFLPDDFHTIEVTGGKPSLHLHLYGMSLENLPERVYFSAVDGGSCAVFGAPPNIACPLVPAAELKALQDRRTDMVVLDSRPLDEYRKMSIPGGIACPGAELVYRFHDTVRSPETLVVVTCAGRTRSIIGTQSLIDAGVPNRVVALENGTMGWHLAGFALAEGETHHAAAPTPDGAARAREAAARVAQRCGVEVIGRARLA